MNSKASGGRRYRVAVPVTLAALSVGASVLAIGAPAQAASTVACTSQPVQNADDGYIVLGSDANLRKAPYGACGVVTLAKANTKIWTWCTVENDYGNTWIWGRIDGTQTQGWMWIDNAKEVVDKPTVDDGFCPGETPPDVAAIDGADRVVEVDEPIEAGELAQDFDASVDVDPLLPTVTGVEDGTAPADDYVALEGEPEAESPDVTIQAAAAKMKYGAPIKRSKVIARAKNWYARNVPYSQSAYAWDVNHGKKFRTDCSGFVSMSWGLTTSRNTRNLHVVGTRINWSSLKPGDMLLRNGHVQLFEKWANRSKTKFWIYEEGSTASDMNHYKVNLSSSKNGNYKPYKYKKIRN
ncbi:MAG TPA: hypothetical protein VK453_15850 [Micromonosporaceae bacterium]|nr:hypothetical protein [Micromonosporaceae bacterium]